MKEINNENKSICSKCGGLCCQKSGCILFTSDLKSKKEAYITSLLDEGRISISSELASIDGVVKPILMLRARNINNREIDLLSISCRCLSLIDDHCYFSFENRPGFGRGLVPSKNGQCFNNFDIISEIQKWLPFQSVLANIIYKKTGKNYLDLYKEDVEEYVFNVLSGNYPTDIQSVIDNSHNLLSILEKTFPIQYARANLRYLESKLSSTYVNPSICQKCGGECCKVSGCEYFASDLKSFDYDYIDKLLQSGEVSITDSFAVVPDKNNEYHLDNILMLRARNKGMSEIDLISAPRRCAMLKENGCTYDFAHRPGEGRHLVPNANHQCYVDIQEEEEIMEWLPLQDTLKALVKKYRGVELEEAIRDDVYNLFVAVLEQNFPYSTQAGEALAFHSAISLARVYKDELEKARRYVDRNKGRKLIKP